MRIMVEAQKRRYPDMNLGDAFALIGELFASKVPFRIQIDAPFPFEPNNELQALRDQAAAGDVGSKLLLPVAEENARQIEIIHRCHNAQHDAEQYAAAMQAVERLFIHLRTEQEKAAAIAKELAPVVSRIQEIDHAG